MIEEVLRFDQTYSLEFLEKILMQIDDFIL